MTDQVLGLFADYGLATVFVTIFLGAIGLPLPSTLLLLTVGALLAQGDIDPAWVISIAVLAAVLGDQVGFGIGRRAGAFLPVHADDRSGIGKKLGIARQFAQRWGVMAVFLSRWLVSPVGPWINISCGLAEFSWRSFTFWGIAGELVWVSMFLGLGYGFSRSVGDLADLVANASWLLVGLGISVVLGWKLATVIKAVKQSDKET
jgi:membrane protein DedA with SNARE-associated domain